MQPDRWCGTKVFRNNFTHKAKQASLFRSWGVNETVTKNVRNVPEETCDRNTVVEGKTVTW